MEKIKFSCSTCGKTLAIDAKHAGKVAPCPGCKTSLTIPAAPTEPTASPSLPDPLQTTEPLPSLSDPLQTPATEPLPSHSDPLQTPPSDQPTTPVNPFALDTSGTPNAPASPSGLDGLAAASSLPSLGTPSAAGLKPSSATPNQAPPPKASFGKSFAGLLVAVLVAGVFTVLWLVIAAVTGFELGILAWGMGGAVGLVAGVIARNPSKVYCGLAAAIAVMSVLTAKGIMAALIMLMSWGADVLGDMADLTPERQKLNYAMADQMLVDGKFDGLEEEYVQLYTATFFSGDADIYDEMTEEMFEISDGVEKTIRDELKTKTPEEETQLLAAARQRHPEWIENHDHFLAVTDEMLNEEGALTEELAAHAKSDLAPLDQTWDEAYYESVAPAEMANRRVELRKLAAERLAKMSEAERDQAVRNTLERHLTWQVYPDAYHAMLEKLHNEGAFSGPLAEHAKANFEYEFTEAYPDYFDEISDEDSESRDKELRTAVNKRLVPLDSAGRAALIAQTKARHPDWYGESMPMDEAQQEMEDALDEIGGDGTFWGSLAVVFSPIDLLWLFLGASTAFGTAHKYGTQE